MQDIFANPSKNLYRMIGNIILPAYSFLTLPTETICFKALIIYTLANVVFTVIRPMQVLLAQVEFKKRKHLAKKLMEMGIESSLVVELVCGLLCRVTLLH